MIELIKFKNIKYNNMYWKPIETQKPKDNEKVLISSEFNGEMRMVTAVYKSGKFMAFNWFTDDLEEAEEFTHWMPWPLPPSQKSECSLLHFPDWYGRCMACGKQIFTREKKDD